LPRSARIAVQVVLIGVVTWFAWDSIWDNRADIQAAATSIRPNWWLLIASGLVVLTAYLLLIETWRRLMKDWGASVRYTAAAHIWFVSVLGRYIPGRVWAAIAVGVMASRLGVSPVAAVGSSLLLTLINIVVGTAIIVALGGGDLIQSALEHTGVPLWIHYTILGISISAIVLLPFTIKPLAVLVRRITKREFELPSLPAWSILRSAIACTVAWALYGTAFLIFCTGLLGTTNGNVVDFVKVYTTSYMLGYVSVFTSSGFVVRELALQALLMTYEIVAVEGQAVLAAWYSRIWLTVLEVLPGVLLLLLVPLRGRDARTTGSGQTKPS
jgi:hypothetical protein